MANVLIKSTGIGKNIVTGPVAVCVSSEDYLKKIHKGDIVVVPDLDDEYIPFVTRNASAIITEEGGLSSAGAIIAVTLKMTVMLGANECVSLLKDGQIITVDPVSGNIYEGTLEE